jgi:acetyl-CoA carboxylase biotin carboxyl carrier protein
MNSAKAPPMAKSSPFDSDLVRELATLLGETDLTEIEVEKGDLRIRVVRSPAPVIHASPMQTMAAAPATASAPAPNAVSIAAPPVAAGPHPGAVPSPMVGTAYLRASPGAKAFVEVGSTVAVGDKILLIEAMKTFNEIVAPRAGKIIDIIVTDGQPVEFGQPLMIIE